MELSLFKSCFFKVEQGQKMDIELITFFISIIDHFPCSFVKGQADEIFNFDDG